ncbi:MAG: hypothetical protein AAF402_12290 [Pseudomonadota bacterium]
MQDLSNRHAGYQDGDNTISLICIAVESPLTVYDPVHSTLPEDNTEPLTVPNGMDEITLGVA